MNGENASAGATTARAAQVKKQKPHQKKARTAIRRIHQKCPSVPKDVLRLIVEFPSPCMVSVWSQKFQGGLKVSRRLQSFKAASKAQGDLKVAQQLENLKAA